MRWLKKYLPLWELGFALIWLICLGNILDGIEAFKPTGSPEIVLTILLSMCLLAIGVYATHWWYNRRQWLIERESKPLIPRKYIIGLVCFVLVLMLFSSITTRYLRTQPEFLEAQAAIKTNPSILVIFGTVKELEMDDFGGEVGFAGGNRYGSYQFKLKGSSRDGIVRISWRDVDGSFCPTKIEEVTSEMPETETTIWTQN